MFEADFVVAGIFEALKLAADLGILF